MTYEERLGAVSDKAWIEWTSGAMFWNAEDEETYELAMQAKRHVQETTARPMRTASQTRSGSRQRSNFSRVTDELLTVAPDQAPLGLLREPVIQLRVLK
jgi:hypothetical protein